MVKRTQRGFSLLELLIVVGIVLVIAAMSTPSVLNTVRRYQLEAATRSVSSVLMRARYEAIRLNRGVSTIYQPPAGNNPGMFGVDEEGPPPAFPDGILQAFEPQMTISTAVQMGGAAPPPLFATMPPNYVTLTIVQPPAFQITFGSVGTVIYQPVVGVGNPWIESNTIYVILIQHNITQQWAAVTVTPAGRVRVWMWNGAAWTS
jgi:prepilin-type N-terminal cleavage/methylation domain-containing protein